jgi:hypothetical protein
MGQSDVDWDGADGYPDTPVLPGVVQIVLEWPEQRRPGRDFDQAVQAEADQGNGPGDQPGDDGDQTFGAVVGDGEVFELTAPANKSLPILGVGCHHSSIIPERIN